MTCPRAFFWPPSSKCLHLKTSVMLWNNKSECWFEVNQLFFSHESDRIQKSFGDYTEKFNFADKWFGSMSICDTTMPTCGVEIENKKKRLLKFTSKFMRIPYLLIASCFLCLHSVHSIRRTIFLVVLAFFLKMGLVCPPNPDCLRS